MSDIQKLIKKKYQKYQFSKKSFNSICFPDKFSLMNQQLYIPDYISKYNKNILLYHGLGSGKTCTAIQIAEKLKDEKKIFLIIPAALYTNWISELIGNCNNNEYISKKDKLLLEDNNLSLKEKKYIYNKTVDNINKIYNIYSYHMFVNNINKINLNNSILILDEVHNIISYSGSFYEIIHDKIKKSKNCIVVALTGTPIYDKPNELGLLMNLLTNDFPIGKEFNNLFIKNNKLHNKNELINKLDGLLSYYEPPSIVFPEKIIKIIKCNMSSFQYNSYRVVQQEYSNDEFDDLVDLPNNFYINSRMTLNMAFPNKKKGYDGYKSITKNTINVVEIPKMNHP